VAQGQDIPVQLGAMPRSVRMTLEDYAPEPIESGDVLISNDPYIAGSNHLNDVCMVMPVFVDGRLFAYSVARAHWMDIGGPAPGGFSVAVWDIYNEGLRIPAVRAYRNWQPEEGLLKLILTNVRGPEERMWDLRAQFAGCRAGERGVRRLCDRYGADTVAACMRQAMDYSERRLRQEIARIPDGTYRFHDYIEGDGWQDRPLKLQVTARVQGDEIEVDYTGTDRQVRGGVNAPRSITDGITLYAIKAITDHTIPSNAGLERPVRVIVPEGTILNPTHPAACSTGGTAETSQRLADLLMGCFAQAVPDRVIAGSFGSSSVVIVAGRDPLPWRRELLRRERVVVMDNAPGGMGARPSKDGVNGIKVHIGNAMETPVEFVEFTAPLRVLRWEIERDTGGAGEFRGGCAASREYEVTDDDTMVTVLAERGKVPPFGLFGGRAGAVGRFVVNPGAPDEQVLPSKNAPRVLRQGERLLYQPAGAGGYGDPLARDAELVLADVLDGYVSAEAARDLYGVVLDSRGTSVDATATTELREALRRTRARASLPVVDRGTILYPELAEER
jgi:N-methylhydantoinase B